MIKFNINNNIVSINIDDLLSLAIGFLGVIFVIQPGFDNFNIYFLVTLCGVFLITTTTTIVNKFNSVTTTKLGFDVFGASKDTVEKNAKFSDKYKLKYER